MIVGKDSWEGISLIKIAEMVSLKQEITLTRNIFTSPGRVYAAFTSPEGWCSWCCEQAEVDAQIGGKLHIYTEGYNAYGKFTSLEQDRIIGFSWYGDNEPTVLIQISVDGRDNYSKLIFKVVGLGSQQDWAAIATFLERIWGHVLDNLKTVLEDKPGMEIR